MKRLVLVLALAAFALAPLAAQERRRVLVGLEAPGFPAAEAEAYAASLDAALARSSRFGAIRRASGPGIAEEAARLGLDLAVSARIELVEAGLRLTWSVLGPASGEDLATGSIESAIPDERYLAEFFWLELVAAAEKAAVVVKNLGGARLVLRGPPGAIVLGLSKEAAEIPASGELELGLKAPATYAWRARASGREDARGTLTLIERDALLELGFEPLRPWTLESGLQNGSFPDFWFSRRLLDDRLFLRAGFHQYLAGLSLGRESENYVPSYLVSIRLFQPGLGAGWTFGRPGGGTRPYVGVTASARLAFPKDAGLFLDPIAPLAIAPYLGIDWKPLRRLSFFLELGAAFYPFGDGVLMAASIHDQGSELLFAYGESWFLEFPAWRLGARMRL